MPADDGDVGFTVSIGVASWSSDDTDLAPALKRADGALYAAKKAGGGRVGSRASAQRPP